MPRISVLIPVYKAEHTIAECVNSLLAQTFNDFEAVFVDDGSPDSCPAMLDALTDTRFRVLHQKNMGQSAARKAAFAASTGDYIAFLDSDDTLPPTALQTLLTVMGDADVAIGGILQFGEGASDVFFQKIAPGVYEGARLEGEVLPRMLYSGEYYSFGIAPAIGGKLVKRALVAKFFPLIDDSIRMGEDGALFFPCVAAAKRIAITDEVTYEYRISSSSISNSYDEAYLRRLLPLFSYLSSAVPSLNKQIPYYATMLVMLGLGGIARAELTLLQKAKKARREMKPLYKYLAGADIRSLPRREAAYLTLARARMYEMLFLKLR